MTSSDLAHSTPAPNWVLRTALHDLHAENGGFVLGRWRGGMEVPAYYKSILHEQRVLRQGCGLVDLGRRGVFRLSGPSAKNVINTILSQPIDDLLPGQWRRIPMVGADGLMVDFVRVGCEQSESYLLFLSPFAAHDALGMLQTQANLKQCELDDLCAQYAWVALVGPRACEVIKQFSKGGEKLSEGEFGDFLIEGVATTLWRKKQDYYELFCQPELLPKIVRHLLSSEGGPTLCGWVAYEAWRLEEGFLRYGFEISNGVTPFDLGLDDQVDLTRPELLARPALAEQTKQGIKNMLVHFSIDAMRLPRKGQAIYNSDQRRVGRVIDGAFSVSLGVPIASGWVELDGVDFDLLELEIRHQRFPIKIYKSLLI